MTGRGWRRSGGGWRATRSKGRQRAAKGPPVGDGVMRLSGSQLAALFDGLDWRGISAPRTSRPKLAGVIGEDRSSRLDAIPARYRARVTRRPKHARRARQEGVARAAAPARLIAGGPPTERLVAPGAGGEIRRSPPLVPPIANPGAPGHRAPGHRAPGHRDRPLDPGLLGRPWRGRDQAAVAADAPGVAAFDQAVCR